MIQLKTITITVVDGESLKRSINMLGINQKDLAKHLHTSQASVSRWVNGVSYVPDDLVKPLMCYIEDREKEVRDYLKGEDHE